MTAAFAARFEGAEHERRSGLESASASGADSHILAPYAPADLGHGFDAQDPVHHDLWRHHLETDHAASQGAALTKPVPAGHVSNKIKIELGHGSITGALTLTIEHGKTGVPLDDGQLKLFKDTLAVKANGLVAKLETALLNDKLEDEILDGVKVVVDVSAMKVGSDGSADLLAIALKLQGDVGHWLGTDPSMKVALDGSIQIALGGKLAAKLAAYTAAKIDREMLAKEAETVGRTIEEHAEAARSIEHQIAELEANPAAEQGALRAMKDELFAHKIQISTGKRQLEGLTHDLTLAENKTKSLLVHKIEGKLARKVAWAMEKKSVKFVVEKLAMLVPILNVASMVVDMVDLLKTIKQLVLHGFGDGGDNETGERGGAGDTAGPTREPDPGVGGAQSPVATPKPEPTGSPVARRIIDAVTEHGHDGPRLDADQRKTLSALIPADLTEAEVAEVISELRSDGTKAKTPEDTMAAIEGAVRRVRDRRRTVMVDGVSRPDLAHGDGDGVGPVTRPEQTEQTTAGVTASGTEAAPASYDVATIVRQAPPSVIAEWFEVKDGVLVASARALDWKSQSKGTVVGNETLEDVRWTITDGGVGQWNVDLEFRLRTGPKSAIRHHQFWVDQGKGASDIGANHGDLAFEPYTTIQAGD